MSNKKAKNGKGSSRYSKPSLSSSGVARGFNFGNLPMMKYGNNFSNYGISTQNNCFSDEEVLEKIICIDFLTFEPANIPLEWGNKSYATSASKGDTNMARLAGKILFQFEEVTDDELLTLIAPNVFPNDGTWNEPWNEHGEFSTPEGQIPLSRLYDLMDVDNDTDEGNLMHSLVALQSPVSSQWNIPFIRIATNHNASNRSEKGCDLSVEVYVWFNRLLFELIADPAIQSIMENIIPLSMIERYECSKRSTQPLLFESSNQDVTKADTPEYRFSLPGVLKSAESTGYTFAKDDEIPQNLKVDLYPFQRSTYKWMLDQENDEGGINSYFWEEWRYSELHGCSMFYFPLAGELRLLRPPRTTGGLLCEEMGLGKTVEVIATILGNPRDLSHNIGDLTKKHMTLEEIEKTNGMWSSRTNSIGALPPSNLMNLTTTKIKQAQQTFLFKSRATLIVIPTVLLAQWWEELQHKIESSNTPDYQLLKAISSSDKFFVPLQDVRLLRVPMSEWRCSAPNSIDDSKEDDNGGWGLGLADLVLKAYDGIVNSPATFVDCNSPEEQGASWAYKAYTEEIVKSYAKNTIVEVRLRGMGSSKTYLLPIDSVKLGPVIKRLGPKDKREAIRKMVMKTEFQFKYGQFLDNHMSDHDIIITNYDTLRSLSKYFTKIHWHRVVLDECQEVKESTGKIATDCAKLFANHRWMVSGTPLVSKIEDLHGELNFLKVWPFSLTEKEDGFWSIKIGNPFRKKMEENLKLLHALVRAVMMRHSKSQRYISSGLPLIKMPARTIEWQGFTVEEYSDRPANITKFSDAKKIKNISECYLFAWLECMAADVLNTFLEELQGKTNNSTLSKSPHYSRVCSFIGMISQMLTHPSTISLKKFDSTRRLLNAPINHGVVADANQPTKMTAQQILALVQHSGASKLNGMNRDTNRVQANIGVSKRREDIWNELEVKTIIELQEILKELDISIPKSWINLPYWGYKLQGTNNLLLTAPELDHEDTHEHEFDSTGKCEIDVRNPIQRKNTDRKYSKTKKCGYVTPPLSKFSINDVLKATLKGNSQKIHLFEIKNILNAGKTVDAILSMERVPDLIGNDPEKMLHEKVKGLLQIGHADNDDKLSNRNSNSSSSSSNVSFNDEDGKPVALYKRVDASRKDEYIELIAAKRMGGKDGGSQNLHDQGFESLFRIMGSQNVECQICLDDRLTRPVVTSCVHCFCFECIVGHMMTEDAFNVEGENKNKKCPICRRPLAFADLYEVDEEEQARQEEAHRNILEKKNECEDENFGDEDGGQRIKRLNITEEDEQFDPADDDDDVKLEEKLNPTSSIAGKKIVSSSSETKFVVPKLKCDTSASIKADFMSLPKFKEGNILPRNRDLPSIEPEVLTHFHESIYETSSRFRAVIADMERVRKEDPFAKFVIYSQYIQSLQAMHRMFLNENNKSQCNLSMSAADINKLNSNESDTENSDIYKPVIIDLSSSAGPKSVEQGLVQFNTDPNCNICLLTTGAAAAGLTLTVARICYMLEPLHNAADEAQALGRIHRIGQQNSVRCVVFYAKNTLEERLLKIRQDQGTLTEMLANNMSVEYVDENENEEDDDDVNTSNQKQKKKRVQPGARKIAAKLGTGKSGFFTAQQLQIIFGVTKSRQDASKLIQLEEEEQIQIPGGVKINQSVQPNWGPLKRRYQEARKKNKQTTYEKIFSSNPIRGKMPNAKIKSSFNAKFPESGKNTYSDIPSNNDAIIAPYSSEHDSDILECYEYNGVGQKRNL